MHSSSNNEINTSASDQRSLLLWDGNCGFCNLAKGILNEKDKFSLIRFRKLQDPKLSMNGSYTNRDYETLYFISNKGVRFTHARAFFEAMAVLPGLWGVAGRAFANRFFGFIGFPFYLLISKNRKRISHWLRLNLEDSL
ncbi:MAG: thiol-disulfide oxidoreductase DCC family protein [Candidatus Heimdallarchaeota archaeon]